MKFVCIKTCLYVSLIDVHFQIQTEVVLLDDQDVAKALIEYISHNFISTFFIGASLKKSITRSKSYFLYRQLIVLVFKIL